MSKDSLSLTLMFTGVLLTFYQLGSYAKVISLELEHNQQPKITAQKENL